MTRSLGLGISSSVSEAGNARTQITTAGRSLGLQVYGNSLDAALPAWPSFITASGGRLQSVLPSGAVGGYRSDQVLAAMQSGGFATDADIVGFGEGTNDAAQSIAATVTVANVRAVCALVIAAQKRPLVRLPPPADTAWAAAANTAWLGMWLLCESLGVAAVDPYARYVDTDGTWVSGASTDQTHPLTAYYINANVDAWAQVLARPLPLLLPRDNTGWGIGTNALNLTDSNADGLPNFWSLSGLTGHTVNALADYSYPFRGKKASVAVSQSAQGNIFKELVSGFAVGDQMRLVGVLSLASASNVVLYGFVRCFGAGVDVYFAVATADMADNYVTQDFTVPAGTTKLQMYLRTEAAVAGAYSGTVGWSLDVINLTAKRTAYGIA